MSKKEGSVAPKERINIKYRAKGDAQEEKELPLKMLMVGDYTLREDGDSIEDRKVNRINKHNFDEVMKSYDLSLNMTVSDKLSGQEGEEMAVKLDFKSIKDFEPDQIVNKVDEMRQLKQLREALVALKSPLGNVPKFRRNLQSVIEDKESRDKLCQELGIDLEDKKD